MTAADTLILIGDADLVVGGSFMPTGPPKIPPGPPLRSDGLNAVKLRSTNVSTRIGLPFESVGEYSQSLTIPRADGKWRTEPEAN